ncbi:MAG: hypothetical protein QM680_13595 [Luteolibacter sp.]
MMDELAISELREVLGCEIRDMPKRALALKRRAERGDDLADMEFRVRHLTSFLRRHPASFTVEKIADDLDAILSGEKPDCLS